MGRRLILGLLILLGSTALCGLVGYAALRLNDPPGNWRNPPLYPGAQQVNTQDFGEWGQRQPDSNNMYTMKVITFTTPDKPEQVKAFYEHAYSNNGWQPSTWGTKVGAVDRLNYSYTNNGRPPSDYFVDVSPKAAPAGGTAVEIGVSMFPGY